MTWRRLVREMSREWNAVRPLRYHHGYPDELGNYAAGNTTITIAPPSYHGWEVLAAYWEISAVAGNVVPLINIMDKDGNLILPVYLPPVTMGNTLFLYLMQGGAFGVQTAGTFVGQLYPLPMDGELKDESLVLELVGGDAADQHRAVVYYEEFDWPPGRENV